MSRRAFVVVADACGAGELPDAGDYGDSGSNTLAHLAQAVVGLDLTVLGRLGLGCILPLEGVPPAAAPALHGQLAAQGYGKDSTSGHWELMGAVAPVPPPTYPHGFPDGGRSGHLPAGGGPPPAGSLRSSRAGLSRRAGRWV